MDKQEKRKKLESLPWQALFDVAVKKGIDESQVKGKEKSAIVERLISESLLQDSEIDDLVNNYIYGDRVSFTLWSFEKKLSAQHYASLFQLEGISEPFLGVNGFRGLIILSVKRCEDRIEVLYVYSKEYNFVNENGKNDSVWEQHRGCLWVGVLDTYLACISKHDKMTSCIVKYIAEKTGVSLTQIKPPKSAIERCINYIAKSRVVLQGMDGEKTIVSRSDGFTNAQMDEVSRIQEGRFDTSGSYIAQIAEDTRATVRYNVKKGSLGIFKHLPASVLFHWSKSAISIIMEEINNLKGRPAKDIFDELGLEIKWAYLVESEKNSGEWFLTQAMACLGGNEGRSFTIPDYAKSLLNRNQLFTQIPRVYCEHCESYEIPYCSECGAPVKCADSGQLYCSCGAPLQLQCVEGHRSCRIENWFIPTAKMYTMLNQNIQRVFKQDTPSLVMCIMGDTLHVAHSATVNTDGIEVHFDAIECFSSLPAPTEKARNFAVLMGEKCNRTCSSKKISQCISDKSMYCLPKAFYSILPGFRPQPHKGAEYGDVSAEVKTVNGIYEMKGIIKKNSKNNSRGDKSIDELVNSHLLSTSKEGEEIIRQFVEQGLVDSRVELIAVIAPQYFDNSFKGTLRYLSKLGGKRVMFVELDDVARLLQGNESIEIPVS